ncbi:hypothetical protein [Actinopolyspora halophila]|uniref:hypothetical protein n=1 Tax=Actinopolyspora halophila TaxID=1850 RepID=UPI00036343CC|nr:hypothetical protein [Actinopolyspora halophila]
MMTTTSEANDRIAALAQRSYDAAHAAMSVHARFIAAAQRDELATEISHRLSGALSDRLHNDGPLGASDLLVNRTDLIDLVRGYQARHGEETLVARETVGRLEWQLGAELPVAPLSERYLSTAHGGVWDRELNRKLCLCGAWTACDGMSPLVGIACRKCDARV